MMIPSKVALAHSRFVGFGTRFKSNQAYITTPASRKRSAAVRKGGISRTPIRMAKKVDPHTK